MPNPMPLDPDHQPTERHRGTHRAGTQDPTAHAARSPELDSSGRPLALRLPEWDLVPPTEFLQRHPDR